MSNDIFPYFSSVVSGIKGGVDVVLGPKTVLWGRNGAGKSAIVQALELATKGEITDAEERDVVKLTGPICRQFPSPPFYSEAVLHHKGTTFPFSWRTEPNKSGGFREPETHQPFRVDFPLSEYLGILKGDAKAVGSWLESKVSSQLSADEIIEQITPTYRDLATSFLARQSTCDLIALAKLAGDEAKKIKTEATKTEKTIQQMTQGVTAPLMSTKKAALEAELDTLMGDSTGLTKEEFDRATLLGKECEEKLAALPATKVDRTATEKVVYINSTFSGMVSRWGMDRCTICGGGDKAFMEKRKRQIDQAVEMVSGHTERVQLEDRLNQLNALLAKGLQADTMPRKKTIMAQLAGDQASRKVWANAHAANTKITEDRAQATMLGLLAAEFAALGKKALEDNKAVFEQNVSMFLAKDTLAIDLDSSRLGFNRNGQVHSGLSGGESNQMLLALGASLAQGSTPSVLIPKDKGWDKDTLTEAMKVLRDAPVQIIIMSTVKPEEVEGWTVIEVGS